MRAEARSRRRRRARLRAGTRGCGSSKRRGEARARSVRGADLRGLRTGVSFGEDQLAVGGDAQAIVLPVVLEDRLALAGQELADLEAAQPTGRRGSRASVFL